VAKVKLTRGELKRQRDALSQFQRYLPTLQLKKQQLQLEILRLAGFLQDRKKAWTKKREEVRVWIGLLADPAVDVAPWIKPREVVTRARNVAGVDVPVFVTARFEPAEYDFFSAPLWIDTAIEQLRILASGEAEIKVTEEGLAILRRELRHTAQRVNLFEKVKIPETRHAIRLIKIYIGDQMANAVGRSKIAKKKIGQLMMEGALS